jgi:hypothetical protein
VNPPMLKPRNKKLQKLTLPRYSGEKNRKGTPKACPNDSVTIRKRIAQYIKPKKLYFKCADKSLKGKKSRTSITFFSINSFFLNVRNFHEIKNVNWHF